MLLLFSSSATLRHRASSPKLIIEATQTKHRNRNNLNETSIETVNNTRASLAHELRASTPPPCILRDIALPPRTVFTVSSSSIATRNRSFNSSRARPAFPGERSKYALDIRRNASRDRTCGRLLLTLDF